jgi:hypothetical protein
LLGEALAGAIDSSAAESHPLSLFHSSARETPRAFAAFLAEHSINPNSIQTISLLPVRAAAGAAH